MRSVTVFGITFSWGTTTCYYPAGWMRMLEVFLVRRNRILYTGTFWLLTNAGQVSVSGTHTITPNDDFSLVPLSPEPESSELLFGSEQEVTPTFL